MPYNFVVDSFHTEKLCSRLFQAKCNFFSRKTAVLRFWAPFGGLRATYNVYLRLIRKHVVDFLLVLIELFSLCSTAETLRANIDWKLAISLQRGPVNPKFQVEGVAPPTILFLRKLDDLSYGIKISIGFSSVLSQSTRLRHGRTDRQTDRHLSPD